MSVIPLLLQIEKIKMLCHARPLAVTFTGMILSSMDAGHVDGCICIYEHSKKHSEPDIGMINAMLKVYGKNDMFYKAKELFEWAKTESPDPQLSRVSSSRRPDAYTYTSMLECSACSLQWEYFEYVYKEMALAGYRLDQNRHAYLLVEASKAGKVKFERLLYISGPAFYDIFLTLNGRLTPSFQNPDRKISNQ